MFVVNRKITCHQQNKNYNIVVHWGIHEINNVGIVFQKEVCMDSVNVVAVFKKMALYSCAGNIII